MNRCRKTSLNMTINIKWRKQMKTFYDIPNILNDISNNLNDIANTLDIINHKLDKKGKKIKPQSNKLQEMLKGVKAAGYADEDNRPAEDILAMIRKRNEDK